MKIIEKDQNCILFDDLEMGEVFFWKDIYYIKTDANTYNAVNLANGRFIKIPLDAITTKCIAELSVKKEV